MAPIERTERVQSQRHLARAASLKRVLPVAIAAPFAIIWYRSSPLAEMRCVIS